MYQITGRVFDGKKIVGYQLLNLGVAKKEIKDVEVVKMLAADLWINNASLVGDTLIGKGVQLKDLPRIEVSDTQNNGLKIDSKNKEEYKIMHDADWDIKRVLAKDIEFGNNRLKGIFEIRLAITPKVEEDNFKSIKNKIACVMTELRDNKNSLCVKDCRANGDTVVVRLEWTNIELIKETINKIKQTYKTRVGVGTDNKLKVEVTVNNRKIHMVVTKIGRTYQAHCSIPNGVVEVSELQNLAKKLDKLKWELASLIEEAKK